MYLWIVLLNTRGGMPNILLEVFVGYLMWGKWVFSPLVHTCPPIPIRASSLE